MTKPNRFRQFWEKIKPAPGGRLDRTVQRAHRVAIQGFDKAKSAGRLTARHILSVQRAAELPEHLVEKSARSTIERAVPRESDRQWQAGYKEVAERHVPALREPEHDYGVGA